MANAITLFRIACSIVLLFCPSFSSGFSVFYIAAGLSDMLDGFVARKTNTVSKLGARLDTIADFVFVLVCLIKLLPVLRIPAWLYGWIGIIALIKVVNLISGFAVQKHFVAVHSVMNKATGALLFLLPLTLPVVPLKYSSIVVCLVATIAAIQEGHFIRSGRESLPGLTGMLIQMQREIPLQMEGRNTKGIWRSIRKIGTCNPNKAITRKLYESKRFTSTAAADEEEIELDRTED